MTKFPRVALLPYGRKPRKGMAAIPLKELQFPLGGANFAAGETIADLRPDDHLLVYPGTWLHVASLAGVRAKLSVMAPEPEAYHRRHLRLLRWLHRRYLAILTSNDRMLGSTSNAVFLSSGNTWVRDFETLDCTKTRMLSLIASAKRSLVGHKLRHHVVAWLKQAGIEADVMGGGYRPFERKSDGLAPYRYSIVIENSREHGYFTEKLVDALLCSTVPIYWGAPDIATYFDMRGMIVCSTLEEVKAAVASISEADYAARSEAIAANRLAATAYVDYELNAARRILEVGSATTGDLRRTT